MENYLQNPHWYHWSYMQKVTKTTDIFSSSSCTGPSPTFPCSKQSCLDPSKYGNVKKLPLLFPMTFHSSQKIFQDKSFHLPLNFLLPPNFNFFLFLFGVVGGRTDHWCQWHLEFEVTYKILMGIRIDERDRKGPRKVSHVDETNGPLTSWTLSKCPSLLGMLQIFNPGTQWS